MRNNKEDIFSKSHPSHSFYSDDILPPQNQNIKRKHNILFSMLSGLLEKVWTFQQSDKQISNDDLSHYITSETQVRITIKELEEYKRKNPDKFSDPNNFNLYSIYVYLTGKSLAIGILQSIAQTILSCGGVMVLDVITNILKNFSGNAIEKVEVCFLLVALVILFVSKNIMSTQYNWTSSKWNAKALTTLQYLVFTKAMNTSAMVGKEDKSGNDNDKQDSKNNKSDEDATPDVNNILTVDIEKQLDFFWAFSNTVTSLASLVIILSLIYYKLGNTMFRGLYILAGAFIFNIFLCTFLLAFGKVQMQRKDKRVCLSKDVIEGMKSIKYLGWETIFKDKIDAIRKSEFIYVAVTRILDGILSVFWACVNYFLLFFFLTDYEDDGNDIRGQNVFTIIALFGYLTEPIGILPWTLSYLVKSHVSFNRIKKFLNQKELDFSKKINLDKEVVEQQHRGDSRASSFLSNNSDSFSTSNIAIQIQQMNFSWPQASNSSNNKKDEKQKQQQKQKPSSDSLKEKLLDENINSNEAQINSRFSLKISDLTINKGELAVVIGKIGCGKSALLNGILNELESESANQRGQSFVGEGQKLENFNEQIIVNGSTAYVSQNHWLQNKSIRENILFGEEFDQEWYDTVIESADLKVDFSTFMNGDQKVIGPGGGNLSGGQRQRVALSRALYQKKEIYLFDDIFSSLDAHVADKIYKVAIIDLLIKKMNRTVVLVTSHFSIFKENFEINQIVYIEKGQIIKDKQEIDEFINYGFIQEQKDAEEKKNAKKFFLNEQIEEDEDINQVEESKQVTEDSIESEDLTDSSSLDTNHILGRQVSSEETKKNQQIVKKKFSDEGQEEEREKGDIKLETFTSYFRSMGWFFLIIFIISNFLMEASQILIDFWLRDYVHPADNSLFQSINSVFNSFAGTFLFLMSFNVALTAFRGIFYCICALLSTKRMFTKLNKYLMFSKMNFYDKNPVGRIVNRIADDVSALDDYLPWACHIFLKNLAYSIGYPVGVIIQFPYLSILLILTAVLIYKNQKFFRITNREVKRLNSVNSGKVLSVIGETCKGLVLIRSFDKQKHVLEQYLKAINDSVNSSLLAKAISQWMTIRLLFISNIILACVAVTSALFIIFDPDFDYSKVAMCLTYSVLLSGYFSSLLFFFCSIEQSMVSVERIRQYFFNPQEEPDALPNINQKLIDIKSLQSNTISSKQLQNKEFNNEDHSQYSVEFDGVYITYDDHSNKILTQDTPDIQYALKNVSLKIKKGEKIAFCGRTGSGKTSILNTLFGMYPIQFGQIYVQGKNIQTYTLRQLRDQMSIIPQFGFLYKESLLQNLDPGSALTKEVVQQKINATNLKIKEPKNKKQIKSSDTLSEKVNDSIAIEIDTSENDLNLEIEDGGENLSNGEKQIVNFLRVILRDTDIVCLDEATSNMDPKTDSLLHEQIFKFTQDKTLLVITHRLENIELFDKVVVLEKGCIAECGHVNELRQIKGGFFNKLIQSQK